MRETPQQGPPTRRVQSASRRSSLHLPGQNRAICQRPTYHAIDPYFLLFPLQTEVPHPVSLDPTAEIPHGGFADQDPARVDVGIGRMQLLVETLQSRCGIDGVPDDHIFGPFRAAERARNYGAGENSDAHSSRRSTLRAPASIQITESAFHGEGTVHGIESVPGDLTLAVPRHRYAEDGDDRITGVLLDHALVRAHRSCHGLHVLVQPLQE